MRYKRFFPFLKKYRKGIVLAFLFTLIDVLGEIVQPTLMSKIVDIGVANKNLPYIFKVGGFMVLMGTTLLSKETAPT